MPVVSLGEEEGINQVWSGYMIKLCFFKLDMLLVQKKLYVKVSGSVT